jgi:hypothetical protein
LFKVEGVHPASGENSNNTRAGASKNLFGFIGYLLQEESSQLDPGSRCIP